MKEKRRKRTRGIATDSKNKERYNGEGSFLSRSSKFIPYPLFFLLFVETQRVKALSYNFLHLANRSDPE